MTPFVFHDLQDSQIFALAQAAGRAGFVVDGTTQPMEPWVQRSRWIRRAYAIPCLSDVTKSLYALQLKQTGLSGVWLACTDDVLEFTVHYRSFLEKMGMRFLAPSQRALQRVWQRALPEASGLKIPWSAEVPARELMQKADGLAYPLIVKLVRNDYRIVQDPDALRRYLAELGAEDEEELKIPLQQFVPGPIDAMASAIVLCDTRHRAVRVFTARRLRACKAGDGFFGETTAARAEWIPELADAACRLLEALGWQGFAEVEAKQGPDGCWYLLEVNPRISGWACLAEADGAGLLRAYYELCTNPELQLQRAALQRNEAEYIRLVATVYHEPDWGVETQPNDGWLGRIGRALKSWARSLRHPDRVVLGAWDWQDLAASWLLLRRSVRRVWARARGRTQLALD